MIVSRPPSAARVARALLIATLLLSDPLARAQAQPADESSEGDESGATVISRDQEARQAFLVGRDAHEAGDFETALAQFQASYAASGRPEILYNIGTSLDRLGRFDEALEYFRRYLEALPDAENHEFVRARMEVLQRLIDRREADAAATEAAYRAVDEARRPPSIVPPIVILGAGAALGIVSVGLLVRGHGQLDDLEAQCEAGGCRMVDDAIDDSGVERTRRAVRALGIGGAALAAGGALWLLLQDRGSEDDGAEESGVQLRTSFGLGTVQLSGTF